MAENKNFNVRLTEKHDISTNWAQVAETFVPFAGEIIVYDDYYHDSDNNAIPAIKIGDGATILANLRFVGELHADKKIIVVNEDPTDDTKLSVTTTEDVSDAVSFDEDEHMLTIAAAYDTELKVKVGDEFVSVGMLSGGGTTDSGRAMTNDEIDEILANL